MKERTETVKTYIAGLIDGESSILLERKHSNEHRSPAISIATTTIELIDFIPEYYGGHICNKRENGNYKPAYIYHLNTTNAAIEMMTEIYPYLKCKKKRARVHHIITYYKAVTSRNGRYTPEKLAAKLKFLRIRGIIPLIYSQVALA